MAKIVWSVPLLQFGRFEIEATPEELGVDVSSPHSMAMAYAVYAQLAAKGYDEGLKMDVDAFIGKPGHVTDQYQESSEKEAPPGDPEAAKARLDAGKKPRTVDEAELMAESLIKSELGVTRVEPWTKTPASSTPKAWDNFDI